MLSVCCVHCADDIKIYHASFYFWILGMLKVLVIHINHLSKSWLFRLFHFMVDHVVDLCCSTVQPSHVSLLYLYLMNYLGYISAISRLYLGYISAISRLCIKHSFKNESAKSSIDALNFLSF